MTASSTSIVQGELRPIRRWLQVNVCILCCLGGIVFAAAEGSPLALISLPVAVVGLLFVDRRGAFGISPLAANLLGLGAFVAAGIEFFGESIEGRLLGFGHLLVYLTWILLLQRKGKAQFWWLCALSALQLATASVLTNELWFPISAIVFMMLSLWTLSVFSLDRAVARSAGVEQTAYHASRGSGSDGDATEASRSRSNVQLETASRWFTPRFVGGVVLNGVLSLMLGLSVFMLTPRIWAGGLRIFSDESPSVQPITGFAEEVSLGDMGEILENPDLVLELEFYDDRSGERLDVETTMMSLGYDSPLVRGKVLGHYQNGRWSTPGLAAPVNQFRLPRNRPLLRQEIRLHPIGTRTLFAADYAIAVRSSESVGVTHELFNNTFMVDSDEAARRHLRSAFDYTAYSSRDRDESGSLRGPWLWRRGSRNFWELMEDYHSTMLSIPGNLNRLERLAKQMSTSSGGTPLPPAEVTSILVNYLKNSGEFGYTLSVSVDDPGIDPVEDFLFNRKQGHCEYFASALALMLRSVGIPSRLISGFKGGERNPSTGRFEIRQLHAHAWVEALVEDRWIVLDPTPASRDESVAAINTSLSTYTRVRRFLQGWWSQGLLMNQLQQRRLVYQPLGRMFRNGIESVRRVGLVQASLSWLRELSANPEEWISIRGFVTAFVLLLLLSGVVWLFRRLWRLLSGWSGGRIQRARRQRRVVAFYERFRKLVARRGHTRRSAATPLEFATGIEKAWQMRTDVDGLVHLPTDLTDAYYRVRYGDRSLSEEELEGLEGSLDRLESWLKSGQIAAQ